MYVPFVFNVFLRFSLQFLRVFIFLCGGVPLCEYMNQKQNLLFIWYIAAQIFLFFAVFMMVIFYFFFTHDCVIIFFIKLEFYFVCCCGEGDIDCDDQRAIVL